MGATVGFCSSWSSADGLADPLDIRKFDPFGLERNFSQFENNSIDIGRIRAIFVSINIA